MAFDETIKAGATSKIIEVGLRDSATGLGKTALAHTAVTARYVREGGTGIAITLAAGTAGDAYSSGKWAEIDATNSRGLYQLHVPNTALASGVEAVTITLQATGVIDKHIRIKLIQADVQDAVRLGLSALQNAAAPAIVGQVSDVAPAANGFDTNLALPTGYLDGMFLYFVGSSGIAPVGRKITSHSVTNGALTFTGASGQLDEPFPAAPANGDTFIIACFGGT